MPEKSNIETLDSDEETELELINTDVIGEELSVGVKKTLSSCIEEHDDDDEDDDDEDDDDEEDEEDEEDEDDDDDEEIMFGNGITEVGLYNVLSSVLSDDTGSTIGTSMSKIAFELNKLNHNFKKYLHTLKS